MAKVLDLDLDFFTWPRISGRVESRPSNSNHFCATEEQVKNFLESQCGLSREHKIPGHFCKTHDGAFDAWKQWLSSGSIDPSFEVHHADAHSDLSFGDESWSYILTEHLALPVEERSNPERRIGRLNEGSYLTFAIANRWIEGLSYIYPVCGWDEYDARRAEHFRGRPSDLNLVLFRDQKFNSGFIELLHVTKSDERNLLFGGRPCSPISVEPAVPIKLIPANEFSSEGYSHLILAHSENYCPEKADALVPIIKNYFYEDFTL